MASSVKNLSLKPFNFEGLFFILKYTHDNIKEMQHFNNLLIRLIFNLHKTLAPNDGKMIEGVVSAAPLMFAEGR